MREHSASRALVTLQYFSIAIGLLMALAIPSSVGHAGPIEPKGRTNDSTPTFRWDGNRNASHFMLEVFKDGRREDISKRRTSALSCRSGGTCRYTLRLDRGNYQWRVKPVFGSRHGRWSSKASFEVTSGASSSGSSASNGNASSDNRSSGGNAPGNLIEPSGSVSGGRIAFKWSGERKATKYLWRVRQGRNVAKASRRSTSAYNCRNGGTCQYSTSLGNGSYTWQVKPYYGSRQGKWSPEASFTVGGGGSSSTASNSGDSGPSGGGGNANVRNQSQFNNAVRKGQRNIIVANGTYQFPKVTRSNVTIKAASFGKVTITNRAVIRKASNVTVQGFKFYSRKKTHTAILCETTCNNLTIKDNTVRHMNADYGIRIHRSRNVKILNNLIDGSYHHAVSAKDRVFNMEIKNNKFVGCGLLCVQASQQTDGTYEKEETSDNIRVENNQFVGRNVGGGNQWQRRGVRLGNAQTVYVRNNKFTGSWKYPVESNFSVYGAGKPRKGRLGHYGGRHPQRAYVERNTFSGGTIDLAGRGRKNDTIIVKNNRGSAKCQRRNTATRTSAAKKYMDRSTVYNGKLKVQASGNSFGRCR